METAPLGKPSGIPLADHRRHVVEEAERLLGLRPGEPDESPGLPFLATKYARLTGGADLAHRVRQSAWYHDRGKAHPHWQDACRADYRLYQDWRRRQRLDPNAVDAADWRRYGDALRGNTGPNLMRSGLRHEIASLKACDDDERVELSLAERVAIAAHHGKLGARHERRWREDGRDGEFSETWDGLVEASREGLPPSRPASVEHRLRRRYEVAGVRALLQLADTRASRAESGGALAPVVPFHYDWPHPSRRPVQDLVLEHADDAVTVLRAPTGSGKTDAALLWGQHQVDAGRADRVVVAMPTRFTATALAVGAQGSLSDTGLYHSSAWHARFGDLCYRTPAFELAQERHGLARRLASPFTVCTVDHLLLSLTGAKEDHHATFFFLANAAVVFDEVDFYDPFVQANLVVLLHALRVLDVPVLLMSATVPESARQLYGVETEIRETEDAQASGARRVHRHPAVDRPQDAADLLDQMIEAGTGIVYANTVERAYRYWTYLRERADGLPVILYHSRFTEPDKKTVEDALIAALGRKAWEGGTARGIAVLTQIGEMSVNVSAPLMLSDLCPWDRLAQRAGRLARFYPHTPEGDLYVADPGRDGGLYPAPYGSFDGPSVGWTAGAPLLETRAALDALTASGPAELSAAKLVDEVNALYPRPDVPDARARENAATLRQMIRQNWMIVPKTEPRDDEANVPGQWQSRDIPAQRMIYVLDEHDLPEEGSIHFPTFSAFHRLGLEAGVSVPTYLGDRGLKRGLLSTARYVIGDDREEGRLLYVVPGEDGESAYSRPTADGVGGGLGALSLREAEDSFSSVSY